MAQNHSTLLDLQNEEMYSGHPVSCNTWMNINLQWGDVHFQEQGQIMVGARVLYPQQCPQAAPPWRDHLHGQGEAAPRAVAMVASAAEGPGQGGLLCKAGSQAPAEISRKSREAGKQWATSLFPRDWAGITGLLLPHPRPLFYSPGYESLQNKKTQVSWEDPAHPACNLWSSSSFVS